MCIYQDVYITLYIYMCIHVCVYIYIHIYIHTHIYICIHTYIYIYIHMYIYTWTIDTYSYLGRFVQMEMAPLKMGQSLRPRPMPRKQMPGGQGVRRSVVLVQNLEDKHGCYMIFIFYKYI